MGKCVLHLCSDVFINLFHILYQDEKFEVCCLQITNLGKSNLRTWDSGKRIQRTVEVTSEYQDLVFSVRCSSLEPKLEFSEIH